MFEASQNQLKDLLFTDDKVLKIPKYQRPYTWTKDQMDDFWEDAVVNDSPFIGTFIINTNQLEAVRVIEVIDGQQRLLTVTIFLAVLRDVARSVGLDELANRIHLKTIVTEDFRGVVQNRLQVGESLRDIFANTIQNKLEPISLKINSKEEKLVFENYEYFSEKMIGYTKSLSEEEVEEKIQEILNKISSINCVVIKIDNDLDAYSIFETVNARGVDLSVADLLKNYFFKNLEAEGKLNHGIKQWEKLSANILDTEVDLKKFLRYFWLSKYGFVTERELFKDIKKQKISSVDLLDEIVSSSEIYLKMFNNNTVDWSDYAEQKTIKRTLDAVDIMGVTQCHVLFMAILRNPNDFGSNLKRVFNAVERFTFLYSAVSKLQANKIEKLYSKYSTELEAELSNKNLKNRTKNLQRIVDSLISDLRKLKPGEGEFMEKFEQVQYKNSKRSRQLITYILSNYDIHRSGEEKLINFDVVNIEHLIPQNPSSDWDVNKKDIKNYVNLLGNLVLVHKDYNAKAGNKSLRIKCKILNQTQIETTKEVIESIIKSNHVWNESDISSRQEDLARKAYSLWSF